MRRAQVIAFLLVLIACVGCDHAVKQIAEQALGSGGFSVAADLVRFELAHNPGAFLSLGESLPPVVRSLLFLLLVPMALLVVCGLVLRAGVSSRVALLGLALIVGGGLGNWLDRLLHGGVVTDYVSVGFGVLRTGIFNLADVAIVLGVVLVLFSRGDAESAPEEGA